MPQTTPSGASVFIKNADANGLDCESKRSSNLKGKTCVASFSCSGSLQEFEPVLLLKLYGSDDLTHVRQSRFHVHGLSNIACSYGHSLEVLLSSRSHIGVKDVLPNTLSNCGCLRFGRIPDG